MQFRHEADRRFLETLLCRQGESLAAYGEMFDFRPHRAKRGEFDRLRDARRRELIEVHGAVCQLRFSPRCTGTPDTIDHLISLATNVLNKARGVQAIPGRKVVSQSLGSNHIHNLALACNNCNGHKKHRFLTRDQMRRILDAKRRSAIPSATLKEAPAAFTRSSTTP
jgi:5-methylcytosine-specific restriction endonuclease McrA